MTRRHHLLVLLSLLGLGGSSATALADDQAKPVVTIIVESGEILAGQAVGLHVWVENPTTSDMKNLQFHYDGPAFLQLGAYAARSECVVTEGKPILLADISAGSVLSPPAHLCLVAKSQVEERDVSVGFSLDYTLVKSNRSTPGFVVAEKKFSVGLFGTESVGGISLRLAAFVIPGLLFMMIVRVGRFPWLKDLQAAEAATVSVLLSVVLFFAASQVPRFNLTFAGIGSSVSAGLFLVLCIVAAVISGGMVLIYQWVEANQADRRKALLVDPTDDIPKALERALRGAGSDFRPVTVVTQNQETFVGSAMAPTTAGDVALLGWFELTVPPGDHHRNEIVQCFGEGRLLDALLLARRSNILPEMRNPIRTLSQEGVLDDTTHRIRRFRRRDVQESSRNVIPALTDEWPLRLRP